MGSNKSVNDSVSASEDLFQMEKLLAEENADAVPKVDEDNRMVLMYPWKCPRTDAKKLTTIVALPSGVTPEAVEFAFESKNPFHAQMFSLSYPWPEKFLDPAVIFKVDMRKDGNFYEKGEFVEFRAAVRMLTENGRKSPFSKISVKLPFPVQRNTLSYTVDLRRFGTEQSTVLARGKDIREFATLNALARNVKRTDNWCYFMIMRFTGLEVEGEDRQKKKAKVVQDCDESSLSMSDEEYQIHKSGESVKKDALINKEVHINRNDHLENMSQNLNKKYKSGGKKKNYY